MEKKNNRILSVDVLRGFDMFWLIGGAGLAISFFNLFPAVLSGGNIEILVGEEFFPLLLNAASFTLVLLLLRFMYNKKIFIKV